MEKNTVIHAGFDELCRLIDAHPENADVFERLDFLWPEEAREETHFVALTEDKKILAVGSVRPNPKNQQELWLTHVSVDPQYKNQGHGKHIIRNIFDHAAKAKLILTPSSFEEEGRRYLVPIMPRLHLEFPDLEICYPTRTDKKVDGRKPYILANLHSVTDIQILSEWSEKLESLIKQYADYEEKQAQDITNFKNPAVIAALRISFRERSIGNPLLDQICDEIGIVGSWNKYTDRHKYIKAMIDLARANDSSAADKLETSLNIHQQMANCPGNRLEKIKTARQAHTP